MNRTTDKHSPRVDQQLAHEEAALVQGAPDEGRTEPRRMEAPSPGEGGIGARPEVEQPAGSAPPWSEQEGRAALAATFPPSAFPARPSRLAELAADAFADDVLVDALGQLPDRDYASVVDLDAELRNHADTRAIVTRANR